MTVYIVQRHYDHEGFDIIGVCDTYEFAEKTIQEDAGHGDFHKISEYTVESED